MFLNSILWVLQFSRISLNSYLDKLYHNTLRYHNPAKYSVKDYNLVNNIKYFNNRNLNQKKKKLSRY